METNIEELVYAEKTRIVSHALHCVSRVSRIGHWTLNYLRQLLLLNSKKLKSQEG